MDKEDEICVYNRILLSHKKAQNNAICSNMDGPRVHFTDRPSLHFSDVNLTHLT